MTSQPTVCVHGLGRIGLPTALVLAQERRVTGVDIDADQVATLRDGRLPFEEPGLADLFETADGFTASTEPVAADVHLLTVPTPLDRETNVADLSAVQAAATAAGEVLRDDDLIVLESTAPPGTTARLLAAHVPTPHVAYCPERAMPPDTVAELVANDRTVGGLTDEATARTAGFYRSFCDGTVHETDATTAEFVKLLENTQRDVDIALANEFALLAEEAGVDVHEAIDLANHHPRVNVLQPGPGVGGHCITVDPWFLTGSSRARLIPQAREVNDTMPDHVLRLVRGQVGDVARPTVAVFGVAYKGNVGDTRETPVRRLIRRLENEGCRVAVHDPHVESFDRELVSATAATDGADCLVVATDHDAFTEYDPERFADRMAHPRLVDTRDLLGHDRWTDAGFSLSVLGDGS